MKRFFALLLPLTFTAPLFADPFEFKDGDRVVFLGSTLVEREQKYGHWEYALTVKNRDRNVIFRNLGWSGDTVWGEARNGFDQSPKGYERLLTVTRDQKPTVILVCYGQNESFEGPAGVAKFTAGYEKLLNDLSGTKARFVLLSPTPFEKVPPLKSTISHNSNLAKYRDAIKAIAEKRNLEFVDLFEQFQSSGTPLTENGIHMADEGYRKTAVAFAGTMLPLSEPLMTKIQEKNQLFFHRWRPQNETYLFLFRKHEQGNNAKDIPAFDPLIAKVEEEIAKLKRDVK